MGLIHCVTKFDVNFWKNSRSVSDNISKFRYISIYQKKIIYFAWKEKNRRRRRKKKKKKSFAHYQGRIKIVSYRVRKKISKINIQRSGNCLSFGQPTTAILDDDERSEPSRGSVIKGLAILTNAMPSWRAILFFKIFSKFSLTRMCFFFLVSLSEPSQFVSEVKDRVRS